MCCKQSLPICGQIPSKADEDVEVNSFLKYVIVIVMRFLGYSVLRQQKLIINYHDNWIVNKP